MEKMCLQFYQGRSSLSASNKYPVQKIFMAHIVTSKCLGCKFTDCVEVCPVACFYELDGQLVIHPDECIDCTACVAECPVEAIYAEGDLPSEYQSNIELNATEAKRLKDEGKTAILKKKDPLPTAEARKAELGY
jgi:ferredoxin